MHFIIFKWKNLTLQIIQTPDLWESYAVGNNFQVGNKDHPAQQSCSGYCSLI